MSLVAFARDELTRAGMFDASSDYGGMLGPAVMKMVEVFADEGHSDFSAGLAIALFKRVANYEPLTPLTGSDDEWHQISDGGDGFGPHGPVFQNVRCSHVFKDDRGAYDIDGLIFREPSGACFTNQDSRVPVVFPYVPKREYVDVPARESRP